MGHLYKLFWTKKIWPGWQGGSKKVKIWPRMSLAFIYFWPRSLLEALKWVKDPWSTPKMIPPTAPDWFESISGVLDPFRGLERAPKPKARPILGNILTYFDPPWTPLPTRSNFLNEMACTCVRHIVLLMSSITVPNPANGCFPSRSSRSRGWGDCDHLNNYPVRFEKL